MKLSDYAELLKLDKKYSRMSMYYSKPMNITVTATWQGIMSDAYDNKNYDDRNTPLYWYKYRKIIKFSRYA